MGRNSLKNVMKLIDTEKQRLAPEQSFLNDLKRSIELTASRTSKKPSQYYKPSTMNCIRQSYYQMTSKDIDEGTSSYIGIGICNSGSDIHVRIQTAIQEMKNNGIDCEWVDVAQFVKSRELNHLEVLAQGANETKLLHKTLNMHFMCDGIIRYKSKYYIVEFKTESSGKFFARGGVDSSHYKQGTAYSLSFELPDVIFIYISRDNLDMKSYMFTPTDEMKQGIVEYVEACDNYVKRLIAPPKPKDVEKKTCNYCPYKTQCRKDK